MTQAIEIIEIEFSDQNNLYYISRILFVVLTIFLYNIIVYKLLCGIEKDGAFEY